MRRRLAIAAICLNGALLWGTRQHLLAGLAFFTGTLILLWEDRVFLLCLSLVLVGGILRPIWIGPQIVRLEGSVETIAGQLCFNPDGFAGPMAMEGGGEVPVQPGRYRIIGVRCAIRTDDRLVLWSRGVMSALQAKEIEQLPGGTALRTRLRESAADRLKIRFGSGAGLVLAMTLGDRSLLDSELEAAFRLFGLTHLLVVSGFHISLLRGGTERFLEKLHVPYGPRKAITAMVLFMLGWLGGFTLPFLRAAGQWMISEFAVIARRRYDALSALSFISLCVLAVNPYAVLSAGYRLSFLAAALMALRPGWPAIAAVQVGILPLILTFATRLSILMIPVNLMMMAVVGLLLPGAMLLWALPPVPLVSALWGMLFQGIGEALSRAGSWQLGQFRPFCPSAPHLMLHYTLLLLWMMVEESGWILWEGRRIRVRCALCAACAWMALIWGTHLMFRDAVLFMDVGSGDAALLSDGDVRVLIDAGGWVEADQWLRRIGVRQLDGVVVSHGHRDHSGGLEWMTGLPIGLLAAPENIISNCGELRYNQSVQLSAGQEVAWGTAAIAVLWPEEPGSGFSENDQSLVLSVRWQGITVLFAGDISSEAEARIQPPAADLLKVAHHGSGTSTGEAWIKSVRPALSVISVGADNPYGHPAPAVIERLRADGSTVLITAVSGSVLVKAKDGRLRYNLLKE